jgi:hypothetical protein
MVVGVLLAMYNISVWADNKPVGVENLKRAKHYLEGTGRTAIDCIQVCGDDFVLDVAIKPKSVKRQSTIIEQSNGTNTYRLLQEGRNVVFETIKKGVSHRVIASQVLERGESGLLSAYYKDGTIGLTVNGKKQVNCYYQIDEEKIAKLDLLKSEPHINTALSHLSNKTFGELSDFRKALKKNIGRRSFKKYADEIIELAHESYTSSTFIGKEFSIDSSALLFGRNFAGKIEQVRIWQPAKLNAFITSNNVVQELNTSNTLKVPQDYSPKVACVKFGIKSGRFNAPCSASSFSEIKSESTTTIVRAKYDSVDELKFSRSNQEYCSELNRNGSIFLDNSTAEIESDAFINIIKQDVAEAFWGEVAEKENIQEHINLKSESIRNTGRESYLSMFSEGNSKNLYCFSYVNNDSESYISISSSFITTIAKDSKGVNSKIDLDESKNQLASQSLELNILNSLQGNSNSKNIYVDISSKLIAKRDQVIALIKIYNEKCPGYSEYLISENELSVQKETFNHLDFTEDYTKGAKIWQSEEFKYVNQYDLSIALCSTNYYEDCICNFGSSRNSKCHELKYSDEDLYNFTGKKELFDNYHNDGVLICLNSMQAGRFVKKTNIQKLEDPYFDTSTSVSLDYEQIMITTGTKLSGNHKIGISKESGEKLIFQSRDNSVLYTECKVPPDIPDRYNSNFQQDDFLHLIVRHVLG